MNLGHAKFDYGLWAVELLYACRLILVGYLEDL